MHRVRTWVGHPTARQQGLGAIPPAIIFLAALVLTPTVSSKYWVLPLACGVGLLAGAVHLVSLHVITTVAGKKEKNQ